MSLEKVVYGLITIGLCITVWFSSASFDNPREPYECDDSEIVDLVAEIEIQDMEIRIIEEIDKRKRVEEELNRIVEPITSRRATDDYDVSRRSGRTAEEINSLTANTGLSGLGEAIIYAEKIYSVNALFILSVAQLESAHGTSGLAVQKNNLFGMNAWGSTGQEIYNNAFSYDTKPESINDFARRIRENYIDKGRDTVKKISVIYCELPQHWYDKITVLMEYNNNKIKENFER